MTTIQESLHVPIHALMKSYAMHSKAVSAVMVAIVETTQLGSLCQKTKGQMKEIHKASEPS